MADSQSVTDVLKSYAAGGTTREAMLAFMRAYPWKAVKASNELSDTAWENAPYPQPGTVQEVMFAAAGQVISTGDRNTVLDIVRELAAA